jgi:hypothetical protein
VRNRVDHQFRQLDEAGSRAVGDVGLRALAGGRTLHVLVPVAKDHRPVAAHEVEVLVVVDVP